MDAAPRLAALMRPRELVLRAGRSTHEVRVVSGDDLEIDGRRIAVDVAHVDESTFVVTAGGARHAVRVAVDAERVWAMAAGRAFEIDPVETAPADAGGAGGGTTARPVGSASASGGADGVDLSAPMPATVTAVLVRPGDRVSAGEPLVRLEAMKMELVVTTPRAGRIATVDCRPGDLVEPGRPLVTLEDNPGDGGAEASAPDGAVRRRMVG